MVRHENWPMLLSTYLRERSKMPFQWGVNDCMTFVSKGVEALTGQDFYSPYAGYDSESAARSHVAFKGGVINMISECLGEGSTQVLQAGRGDVVIVALPDITGGLVDDSGSKIAVVSPQGLIRLPLSRAQRVWRY